MFNRKPKPSPRDSLNPWQGHATVCQTIHPKRPGRVSFNGTYWNARSANGETFAVGDVVEVCDRIRLELIVRRA